MSSFNFPHMAFRLSLFTVKPTSLQMMFDNYTCTQFTAVFFKNRKTFTMFFFFFDKPFFFVFPWISREFRHRCSAHPAQHLYNPAAVHHGPSAGQHHKSSKTNRSDLVQPKLHQLQCIFFWSAESEMGQLCYGEFILPKKKTTLWKLCFVSSWLLHKWSHWLTPQQSRWSSSCQLAPSYHQPPEAQ